MHTTLEEVFELKHAQPNGRMGWGPQLRARFRYHSPDDHYEHLLLNLVTAQTRWLDIGAGDAPCSSARVSRLLADRCAWMVGVDPSPNIRRNPFVHEKHELSLEEFDCAGPFDLLTLRMVAEHVEHPEAFAGALSRLARPGGHVVIYTVYRRSPGAVIARVTPMVTHHMVKRWLWGTEERDTFPVFYRMNTPRILRQLLGRHGFREERVQLLDDCRTLGKFRRGLQAELMARRWLNRVGLPYPERCLIGVYRKC